MPDTMFCGHGIPRGGFCRRCDLEMMDEIRFTRRRVHRPLKNEKIVPKFPVINTGRGRMRADEALTYLTRELSRNPTSANPRNSGLLLGIFRQLPLELKRKASRIVETSEKQTPRLFETSHEARKLVREAQQVDKDWTKEILTPRN